jgi:uroporphyrinogen-III synthase
MPGSSCAHAPAPASSTEAAAVQIVITRPRPQAEPLAARLAAKGHACLVEPMLEIEPLPGAPLPLDGVQAIVLTSTNAVPALLGNALRLPVFAVGEATAAAARDAGCARVTVAEGDARSLGRLLAARCRPGDGALLHLSGEQVREGLEEALRPAGLELRRHPVYRAEAVRRLSPELQTALLRGTIGAVLLFSPRTARTFAGLVRAAGLQAGLEGAAALCLSAAVAGEARTLRWREVLMAKSPTTDALVHLLDAQGLRW